jgi:hypothetical protein
MEKENGFARGKKKKKKKKDSNGKLNNPPRTAIM